MPAHLIDSAIFRDLYGTPEMRATFEDRALVQAWLDAEAALARAEAEVGLIPPEAAEEIAANCRADLIDLDELKAQTELVGYPILPLVRQVERHCRGESGGYLHWGATTQDIMDTATALQLARARELFQGGLADLEGIVADLARRYRDTPMAGRTHGQQAAPITFGYKVAVWLAELRRHRERLEACGPRLLVGELAGAVGTLASLGRPGLRVQELMLRALGLGVPPISWHTARDNLAEFACLLGLLVSTLAKIAQEIALLQKSETGEVEEGFEPGRGGSSTMPQKRNPISCEAIIGIAKIVRQDVALALDFMTPDHERATGPWHAEWEALPEICILAHGAMAHTLGLLRNLVVRPERMARNLALSEGLIASEAVMMRLAPQLGRQRAHDVVYEACMAALEGAEALRRLLLSDPEVASVISADELDRLLDPANYTGLAAEFVDRVLADR
jgi:3-carboxy-cis,cis-muconate cycloisomerase